MKNFKQKILYDNEAIIQQAQIYNDVYKVIMEYIDNSIDAAEDYYKMESNSYSKEIQIKITKSGSKKNEKIVISDNCTGMEINIDKPLTIFGSTKRNDSRTNGKFGFGMFSCFSLCNSLSVTAKTSDTDTIHSFEITPQTFIKHGNQDLEIEIHCQKITKDADFKYSGTEITLSDFNPGIFAEFDFKKLKEEIEKHFELILSRINIKIVLEDSIQGQQICTRFKYSSFCDKPYHKTINKLYKTNSKKFNTKSFYSIGNTPVKIFLIAAKDTILNRDPFFVVNGRRVIEISKVDQFRTKNKLSVWSRSNVTGYIDATGILEPIPSRRDFKNTELSKAFFQTLINLENEIKDYIESESRQHLSGRFSKLELMLNKQIQNFLSKYNRDNKKDDLESYKEYKIMSYYDKINNESETIKNIKAASERKAKTEKEKPGVKKERLRDNEATIKIPFEDNNSPGAVKSLKLKIDNINEPDKSISGSKLRSVFLNGEIIIFQKHEEFQKRLQQSSKGHFEINEKIIHYIVMEIITHLQKLTLSSGGEVTDMIFENFVSAVLELEDELKDVVGQKI